MRPLPSRRRVLGAGAAAAGSALARTAAAASERAPLLVVVANQIPPEGLTLAMLRAVFSGESVTLPSGARALPINDAPGAPGRIEFDRRVLKMDAADVSRYWIDRRVRGLGGPPRSVPSPALRQQLVLRLPGVITYVRPGELIAGVRPIRLDGKLPNDAGYPLA